MELIIEKDHPDGKKTKPSWFAGSGELEYTDKHGQERISMGDISTFLFSHQRAFCFCSSRSIGE